MAIVIVHGPQGCGKTRNAQMLRARYGCRRIVDEWDGRRPLQDGDLALTHREPPFAVHGAVVVGFAPIGA